MLDARMYIISLDSRPVLLDIIMFIAEREAHGEKRQFEHAERKLRRVKAEISKVKKTHKNSSGRLKMAGNMLLKSIVGVFFLSFCFVYPLPSPSL